MNSTIHAKLARLVIAAFAVAILGACGADAPAGIIRPVQNEAPAGPQPGDPNQDCFGSALHGEVACEPQKAPATGTPEGGLGRAGSGPEGWS